jgi:sortase A
MFRGVRIGLGWVLVIAALPAAAQDMSRWSADRVRAWRDTQTTEPPPPLAILRIPRIGLVVPVLAGTDAWTLNRAVGHIEETAEPGGDGNVGIAGHRDGFFRGLESIAVGDVIELETSSRVDRYRVERLSIVTPEEVSVIDSTESPSVTLVTCYPFYYVGSAPHRFIVRGVREEAAARPKAPE